MTGISPKRTLPPSPARLLAEAANAAETAAAELRAMAAIAPHDLERARVHGDPRGLLRQAMGLLDSLPPAVETEPAAVPTPAPEPEPTPEPPPAKKRGRR